MEQFFCGRNVTSAYGENQKIISKIYLPKRVFKKNSVQFSRKDFIDKFAGVSPIFALSLTRLAAIWFAGKTGILTVLYSKI